MIKALKDLYVMGENPAMSDPNANHAREALAKVRNAHGSRYLLNRNSISC